MTLRVLVVDDDDLVCRSIDRVLTYRGYQVLTCTGGREALEIIDNHELDVVLSDVLMPEMEGWELLEIIQSRWPSLPVVMFTGFAYAEDEGRARRMGAVALLSKPLRPDPLVDVLLLATGRGPADGP